MSNKVSIKDIKAAVKANKQDTIKFTFGSGENTIDIEFKPRLTLLEESAFVQRVSENVFDADCNYRPEYFSTLFALNVIQFMSNLTIPKMKVNTDEVVDMEEFKAWNDCFEFIHTILSYAESASSNDHLTDKKYSFIKYIDHLADTVWDKINYLKQQKLHTSKFDELCDELKSVVDKLDTDLSSVDMKAVLNKIANMPKLDDKTIIDEIVKASNKSKVVNIKDAKK